MTLADLDARIAVIDRQIATLRDVYARPEVYGAVLPAPAVMLLVADIEADVAALCVAVRGDTRRVLAEPHAVVGDVG